MITPKGPVHVKIKLGARDGANQLILNDIDLSYVLIGFRLEQHGRDREFVLTLSPNAHVEIEGEDMAPVMEAADE
jgi:hypothetical protein